MNEREKIIRLWFDMWLTQQDLGIDEIFTDNRTWELTRFSQKMWSIQRAGAQSMKTEKQ